MTQRERHGWFIVASLFVTLLFAFGGGFDTVPVFIPPLIKYFGWSHAQVSVLPAAVAIAAGLSAPLVGRLLDRFEARIVMALGVAAVGIAFLGASRVNSFGSMLGLYVLLGLGISAGTLAPAAFVTANWFEERRGLALGVVMMGTTIGATVMTQVASLAVVHHGWRTAYVALGLPTLLIGIPAVVLTVRSRPPGEVKLTVAESGERLEGFETTTALRTRSFWLITFAQFAYFFCATGGAFHLIDYMQNLHYTERDAAWVLSGCFLLASVGKIVLGLFADRSSGRAGMAVNFVGAAIGALLALYLRNPIVLIPFILFFGFTLGAPLMLVPVMIAESMGLKRYGSITGLIALASTAGAALGPIGVGWIYDVSGSYSHAYEILMLVNVIGGAAALACLSYRDQRARMPQPSAAVAAHQA
jgi:MFS family permease